MGLVLIMPGNLFACAVMAATTVGLQVIGLGFILKMTPRVQGAEKDKLMTLAWLVLATIFLTSTAVGGYGIAAPQAMAADMRENALEMALRVDRARTLVARQRSLVTTLETEADALASTAEAEETGRFSGKASRAGRPGKIQSDLQGLSKAFARGASVLDHSLRARTQKLSRAAELTLRLRKIADDPEALGTLEEARTAFAAVLLEASTLASEASISSAKEQSLTAINAGMAELSAAPLTAKTSRERARQRAASEAVTELASGAQQRVSEAVSRLPPEMEALRPLALLSPLAATRKYAVSEALLVFWLYVAGLDLLLPLVALGIAGFLSRYRAKRETPPQEQGGADSTLGDERGSTRDAQAGEQRSLHLTPGSALSALARKQAAGAHA